MKYASILAFVFLWACGQPAKTSDSQTGTLENTPNQASSGASVQTFPIPYYLGTEFTGSWVIEMSMEQNGSYTVIFKNSGEGTQFQGSFQKSPPIVNGKVVVAGNESLFNGVLEGASSGLAATIRIKGQECTSKSGYVSPSSCEIKFDNNTYTGCGKFVD